MSIAGAGLSKQTRREGMGEDAENHFASALTSEQSKQKDMKTRHDQFTMHRLSNCHSDESTPFRAKYKARRYNKMLK